MSPKRPTPRLPPGVRIVKDEHCLKTSSGTIIVTGVKSTKYGQLPKRTMDRYKKIFPSAEESSNIDIIKKALNEITQKKAIAKK